jgi:single-stranded-DNA-specific exonuclease
MLTIPDKRWTLRSCDERASTAIAGALKIRKLYGRLLVGREIRSFEEARGFFRPHITDLHDPYSMRGMEAAVQRIDQAVKRREKILIYGDYDADGTTAVAVVFSFLQAFHAPISFYIPDRHREGYGISDAGITHAITQSFSLIIALDCGVKAVKAITRAHDAGLDVIVCDHHLPGDTLPPAVALLNPKQPGCSYPYKELSGCGIGFKLITALATRWNLPGQSVLPYLQLVAISIAADIVPVTGENRVLAYFGLKAINAEPLTGIRALLQRNPLRGEDTRLLRLEDLAFMIGPCVNAAGRMDDAAKAVRLFIEKDFDKALDFAEMLHQDNARRKELDKRITAEALDMISGSDDLRARNTTVLYRSHWHKGVVGIVASRVMECYYRPTIILTASRGAITGSARSVDGFNIFEALQRCDHLLENYGGHLHAAGMTLRPENLTAFTEAFEAAVSCSMDPGSRQAEILIDAPVDLGDVAKLYPLLQQFEPFGPGNTRPVFLAYGVSDNGYSRIVKGDHIRFEVRQGNSGTMAGIGFNLAHKFGMVSSGNPFDLCFGVGENTWKGRRSLQLSVLDIRIAEPVPPVKAP